jgi:hypothetical protein
MDETLRGLKEGGRLGAQLHAITAAFFGYYQQRPKLSRTLLKESLFADAPWAGRFSAQVGKVHARIAELFNAAAARADVRVEPGDGALFGAAYFSFYYFALIAWVQGAHQQPVELVDRLVTQHLRGILPRSEWRTR